jgi:hypothetical protein
MLNSLKFGLAAGILWALYMFVYTILSMYTGYGSVMLNMMANLYPGYTISWQGSIVGLIYGFFDGFIGIFLFAWIYNALLAKNVRK